MKSLLIVSVILLTNVFGAASQTYNHFFTITPTTQKIKYGLYKRIYLYDARPDTANLGVLQVGDNDNLAYVVARPSLRLQLQSVVDSLVGGTYADGDLLFHLRQFRLSERSGVLREQGFFVIRATIYARTAGAYQKLDAIDTLMIVKSPEITKALYKAISKTLTEFIAKNLTKRSTDTVRYTASDIKNSEQIEKSGTPLYSSPVLTDGLYKTYASFMAQQPDERVSASLELDKLSSVKTLASNGKTEKVYFSNCYAIVYQGKPFISTESGYSLMEKNGNDYYFRTRMRPTANGSEVSSAYFWFGFTGAIIAANKTALFEIKLDHLKGSFIPVKRIRDLEGDD